MDDDPHPGRPATIDDDKLSGLTEADPRLTTWHLAEHFRCFHTATVKYLRDIRKVSGGVCQESSSDEVAVRRYLENLLPQSEVARVLQERDPATARVLATSGR